MEPSQTLEALEGDPAATATVSPGPVRPTRPEVTLTPVTPTIRESLHDAWERRGLLRLLGLRYLAKRIQGTKLGRAWLLIRPFMDAIGKSLLFGGVLKLGAPGGVPYYLFLTSGLVAWRMFERSLLYASRTFSLYRKMMKTFRFPLMLVPMGGMSYPALETAIYAVTFTGALVYYFFAQGKLYLQPPPQLLLIVPGAVLLMLITIGFILWSSVLNAKARDTRLTLRYVIPLWMYVTPVVYAADKIPKEVRFLVMLNPLTAPVDMIRFGLIGVGKVQLLSVATSLVFGAIVLASGLWFFNREAAKSIDIYGGGDDDDEEDEF